MDFQIRFLRYFLAIVEERSFSRAAARLGISQPTLSQRIQTLESQLGFPLLTRSRRGVELTDEAARLVEPFRDLVGRARRIRRLADDLCHGPGRPISIGVAMYSDFPERAALLNGFNSRCPDIRLHLESGYTADLFAGLLSARYDLAFVTGPVPEAAFERLVLRWFQTEVIVPANHALACRASVELADLAGEPVASFPRRRYPALYDAAIAPIERAGAVMIHPIDATPVGLLTYARQHRILVASAFPWASDEDGSEGSMVRKILNGVERSVALMLVRPEGSATLASERLWSFAEEWLESTKADPDPAGSSC